MCRAAAKHLASSLKINEAREGSHRTTKCESGAFRKESEKNAGALALLRVAVPPGRFLDRRDWLAQNSFQRRRQPRGPLEISSLGCWKQPWPKPLTLRWSCDGGTTTSASSPSQNAWSENPPAPRRARAAGRPAASPDAPRPRLASSLSGSPRPRPTQRRRRR
jgi:hypothetical protein